MVDLESPGRRWSVRLVSVIAAGMTTAMAQPTAVSPRWQVRFPTVVNGKPAESTAVPINDGSLMVVVVAAGADSAKPTLQLGSRTLPAEFVGYDPVSRLGFIRVSGEVAPKPTEWAGEADSHSNAILNVVDAGATAKCRASGWVKQVGGKILPLALLRVNFTKSVPPPGTPLTDDRGRVVGIVFQSSGNGNVGYAIPAEAMHRVKQDICGGSGQLSRGWLGLGLRAESQTPVISRVLPDSPASAVGIRQNDVLTAVGSRPIADYADAANAFFYLIPGRPVKLKLQRGAEPLEYTLTPVKPK